MSIKPRVMRGMTLIELTVAIVIVSVGLAGVLSVFVQVVRGSADAQITKQMLAIAEGITDEIASQPFAAISNPPALTCGRDTWNDLMDYSGYDTGTTTCLAGGPVATGAIYDTDGTAIPALAGYSVSVDIVDTVLPPAPQPNGVSTPNAKQITVTVRRGTGTVSLISWRTNYAA